MRISQNVARKLGHYVYLLVDPADDTVFYVGKGKGGRALAHLTDDEETEKAEIIRNIRDRGQEPRIEILGHGLKDAETALRIESAAIDLLGVSSLSNRVRGWRSGEVGRMPLRQLIAFYEREPVEITEPAILIRINRLYRYGMSANDLYDVTRIAWRVGRRRERARYAFAVHEGIVREVYTIAQWLPAGSTYTPRNPRGLMAPGRWEFVGTVADDEIRRRYLDKDVGHYFQRGAQNPITYVNID